MQLASVHSSLDSRPGNRGYCTHTHFRFLLVLETAKSDPNREGNWRIMSTTLLKNANDSVSDLLTELNKTGASHCMITITNSEVIT